MLLSLCMSSQWTVRTLAGCLWPCRIPLSIRKFGSLFSVSWSASLQLWTTITTETLMANCKSSRNCSCRYSIICAVLVLKFCSKSSDRSCCPSIGQCDSHKLFYLFWEGWSWTVVLAEWCFGRRWCCINGFGRRSDGSRCWVRGRLWVSVLAFTAGSAWSWPSAHFTGAPEFSKPLPMGV